MRKLLAPVIGAIVWAFWLTALMAPLGCQPYAQQPYQGQAYPGQQYPPPSSWGPRAQAPAHLNDVAAWIGRFTNEIRQRSGLPPLAKDGTLAAIAQAYSDDMLRRGFFSHTNPEGLTVRDRLSPYFSGTISSLGENIWEGSNIPAANSEALARYIMDSWMSSPGHRENILSADYTHLGVGVAALGGEIRATQDFANLRGR
ncbi:MAG: CAP domain-containing protein [Desulfobaccales bacterium]